MSNEDRAGVRLVAVDETPERLVVRLEGEIVYGNHERVEEIFSRCFESSPRVTVDLAGVDFIDSCGVALLVRFARAFRGAGGGIRLTGARGAVLELFHTLSLNQLVDID